MPDPVDFVALYAKSVGLDIRPRTVFVEGTSDADLLQLASDLDYSANGRRLLDDRFAIVAAGRNEDGGVAGVDRELSIFRYMSRGLLLASGRPKYRFMGLVDNDHAGRQIIQHANSRDPGIVEYRTIFRLRPHMPLHSSLDPAAVKRAFQQANIGLEDLDWELEDLLPEDHHQTYIEEYPQARVSTTRRNGFTHRDFDGHAKATFHYYVKKHIVHNDVAKLIHVMIMLRHYFGLQS